MIKIAIITSHAATLTSFRSNLIQCMSANGAKVYTFAPNFDSKTRLDVRALGASPIDFPMSRTGLNPFVDLINTWKLSRLLKKINPSISLSYFIKPVIFGNVACWLSGIPSRFSIVEGLGYVFTESEEKLAFKRKVLKCLVKSLYRIGFLLSSKVFFLNPDDQADLINLGLLPNRKSVLLGGIGVDLNRWVFCPCVTKPFVFLMIGRLLKEKGVFEYASAACVVKERFPHVRFVLLGGFDSNPGSLSKNDICVIQSKKILEWHGHVDVQPWLERASVFVLPSYREGVPVSTQEAMAVGRAIITTNVPGCRETVFHGDNGILVNPQDVDGLADAMCLLVENPKLVMRMGKRSREIAEEKFDVTKQSRKLMSHMGML